MCQELEKGEEDIVEVAMKDSSLVVNELKVKVDLTKFTERHVFNFDDALDESVGNDEVYRSTVQPLVATIFKNGKATCFAYGQTGSGKTFTMQPLPMRAARDMFALLEDPQFADLSLFVSCFEIYGGKLYDLLNGRKRLEIREDGKKRVCIVDLKVSLCHDIMYTQAACSQHSFNAIAMGTIAMGTIAMGRTGVALSHLLSSS